MSLTLTFLGTIVAAIVGGTSSSSASSDQLAAAEKAQALDFKLAGISRQDKLKASKEAAFFNRQQLKQQKELTMAGLGQQKKQFAQGQAQNTIQNRLSYFNNVLAGNTQLQNNLANLWGGRQK